MMSRNVYDSDANGIVDTVQSFHWANIIGTPSTFPPSPHTHLISDVTGLSDALAGKLGTTDNFDIRYYTKRQDDALLATKANIIHFHDDRYVQLTDLATQIDPKAIDASLAASEVTTPLVHSHDNLYYPKSFIDNLFNNATVSLVNDARYYTQPQVDSFLAGKAALVHTHDDRYFTQSQVLAMFAIFGNGLFTYSPPTASATWTINHQLNRYPAVNIVDTSGKLVSANVVYPDANNVVITFAAPYLGSAFLT